MATARLFTVTNEIGGQTVFGYGQPEPCPSNPPPADFHDFHQDCFPGFYFGAVVAFNKWVVTARYQIDLAGNMPVQATAYLYGGGPAWHYSSSPVLAAYGTVSNPPQPTQNWNEFRGFQHVIAKDAISGVETGHRYYRGMYGDRLSTTDPNILKVAVITLCDGTQVTDFNSRAGLETDECTSQFPGGGSDPISRRRTIYDWWLTNGGPVGESYTLIPFQAFFVTPTQVDETALGTPSRTRRTRYQDFDAYGHAQLEIHEGGASTTDDWHIDRLYAPVDPSRWIHGLVKREITRDGLVQNTGTDRTKVEYVYEGGTDPISNPGPGPTGRGLVTIERRYADINPSVSYDTTMQYDIRGRLKKSTDARGNPTSYAYDAVWGAAGSMTVTNAMIPAQPPVVTTSDPRFGLPLNVTDANNHRVKETYDDLGRLTNVWLQTEPNAGPATKSFDYFLWGGQAPGVYPSKVHTTQLQSPNPAVSFTSYSWIDGFGRTIQSATKAPTLSGNDARTSTSYDGSGSTYRSSAPVDTTGTYSDYQAPNWGATATVYHQFTYDELGRVTRDALKNGGTTKWVNDTSYDGWDHTSEPAVGSDTEYKNDAHGNLISVIEHDDTAIPPAPTTFTTNYGYDAAGRLTSIDDASAAPLSTIAYDLLGRKTGSTDPDAGTWSYAYDGADNLTRQTDARGKQVWFEYDALNRLTKKRQDTQNTGPKLAEYTYDAVNNIGLPNVSTSYDAAGNPYTETVVDYDARNRPTTRQWTIPAAATGVSGTYKMTYSYDAADHVTSVRYPAGPTGTLGETVTTDYNSVGYPRLLHGTNDYVTASAYTTAGSLKTQTLGTNAITRNLGYDPETMRLETMKAGSGGSTTNRQNLSYTYDAINNVKTITDLNNASQRQCFKYDGRNRLKRAFTADTTCTSYDNTPASPPPYDQTFTYDPTGSFLTAAGRTYGYGDPAHPHAPTSVDSDAFTYNQNGAEVGRNVGGVGALFSYDNLNRVTSIAPSAGTSSSYVYGADSQRLIRKDGTTVTLYLEGGNYQSRSVNGAAPTVTKYYALGSQRVAVRKGSTLYYELADHLGSASATTDSSGNNLTRQNYFPFGSLRPGPGNNLPVDETFLGKTLDTNTGLVQMGARYFDPAIGRFTSADPLAKPANPQSLNPYTYSLNNPLTLSDPSGLGVNVSKGLEGIAWYCGGHPGQGGCPDWRTLNSPDVRRSIARTRTRAAAYKKVTHSKSTWNKFMTRLLSEQHRNSDLMLQACGLAESGAGATVCMDLVGEWHPAHDAGWVGAAKLAAGVFGAGGIVYVATEAAAGVIGESVVVPAAEEIYTEVEDSATAAADGGSSAAGACHSFAPATRVVLADGSTKPISKVAVDDRVRTTDPATGRTVVRTVTALHRNHDSDLADLVVRDGAGHQSTVHTTQHHRFWDDTRHGWVDTAALAMGDRLHTDDGAVATVESERSFEGLAWMYDLTVDDVHTYYVEAGNDPILVHNCGGPSLDAIKIAQHANEEEHVIPGVDPDELDLYVHKVMQTPGADKVGGGSIWWDGDTGAVVIRNPDGYGTVFTPEDGFDYYLSRKAP